LLLEIFHYLNDWRIPLIFEIDEPPTIFLQKHIYRKQKGVSRGLLGSGRLDRTPRRPRMQGNAGSLRAGKFASTVVGLQFARTL
jgi:hypothetical protein